MQPAIKNDLVHLLQILEFIGKAQIYAEGITNAEEFFEKNGQMNFDACLLMLSNIGEQAGKVSSELKNTYKDIDWQKIKGLRNRVVHDYEGIDHSAIYDIVSKFIPPFRQQLHRIIKIELGKKNFLNEEFEVARESNFYKHIDFNTMLNL